MTASSPSLSDRRLTALSVVLLLGAATTILDTTIVNVALDHLRTVFDASVADMQWVSSGYLLALAGVIPLTGWAADRFGARTVWTTAVAAFLAGSVLCALAWDLPSLIAFRVLQGIGGGMVLPVTMSILTQAAGPARIGRAMAAIVIPAQLAPILGPIVGGALVDSVSWRWLFLINVPLCLAALALAGRYLPAGHADRSARIDLPGFLLLTPGLVGVAYGISQAGARGGFGAVGCWLPMAAGALLVAAFVGYGLRTRRTPIIDVRPLGRRSFGLASGITFVGGFSSFAAMFLLPLFYQQARGESASATGLLLIPQGLGTIAFVLLSKRLGRRVDTRFLVVGGLLLSMGGLLPFALADGSTPDALLLTGQFVQGLGLGAVLLPIMTLAMSSLSAPEVPRASAAFSVVQRVGAPFGVTVVAVLLQSALASSGATPLAAFTSTFWWVIGFSAVPLVLALLLPPAAPRPAAPDAELVGAQPGVR
jgi:EmrB/QacA subfamily drug resistance transporter